MITSVKLNSIPSNNYRKNRTALNLAQQEEPSFSGINNINPKKSAVGLILTTLLTLISGCSKTEKAEVKFGKEFIQNQIAKIQNGFYKIGQINLKSNNLILSDNNTLNESARRACISEFPYYRITFNERNAGEFIRTPFVDMQPVFTKTTKDKESGIVKSITADCYGKLF